MRPEAASVCGLKLNEAFSLHSTFASCHRVPPVLSRGTCNRAFAALSSVAALQLELTRASFNRAVAALSAVASLLRLNTTRGVATL